MATYADIIAGLELFASKQARDAYVPGADHDVLYGAPLDVELTTVEIDQLNVWGWIKSSDHDCWIHFV